MNISEMIVKAIESGSVKVKAVNPNIIEVSKSTKRNPGYLKIAINDEDAGEMMLGGKSPIGVLLLIDRDKYNEFKQEASE